MKSTPEQREARKAISNAANEIFAHLQIAFLAGPLRTDKQREVTANLCEAYLDEWYTYRQLRKGKGEVNGLPHPINPS